MAGMPDPFANKSVPQIADTIVDVPRQAAQQFPFVQKGNPVAKISIGRLGPDSGWAETYGPRETGDPMRPETKRPVEFPYGRPGVEIYRQQYPADYAAEYLHTDPMAHQTRAGLMQSLTPEQIKFLQHDAKDYEASLKEGLTPQRAMQNATDSLMRGVVTAGYPNNQFGPRAAEIVKEYNFTPQQQGMLNNLRSYMTKGAIKPTDVTPYNFSTARGMMPR